MTMHGNTRATLMKIDAATASRLYWKCKAGATLVKGPKESTIRQEARCEILGVSCIIDFGFSAATKIGSGQLAVSACVWIFSDAGTDFFGSFYLPVAEDDDAASVLNSAISQAIAQARDNHKFQQKLLSTRSLSTIHP
jgi:hypothetical protein